ncbi:MULTISPECIES: DinQ-like type I toxin DqlB [Salmonella]|nr:DinQ-like type I toxin DqlB [Salmonella enterica]KFR40682.1 membrane protein [Salmonella enterica subsp. enterica serovar Bareilly str. CFSAN001108]KFR42329.1 membrane protein [Salmonella enterica subsp. enterica serovar Bareilly str. CFSAN001109]KFR46105.1 membrane protein [Salmonella enterica subsp. enterica serovar Bareilly str. CFSAN001102]KFR51110.1 membrane protein [Salmonella enterica subsp. enterica serovar Bareilly str. CFSAN001099]KFR54796.1 membrane protein [Salmonella enterica s
MINLLIIVLRAVVALSNALIAVLELPQHNKQA